MEPNQFDEMARKAVQGKEGNAALDSTQADLLWSQIGVQETKTYVGWWRAAAVILFLLSSSLVWYGSGLRYTQQDLEVQLKSAEEDRLAAQELLKDKKTATNTATELNNQAREVETIIVRDTVVSYIVEERIVYVDREVLISPNFDSDSLVAIIESQREHLAQKDDVALVEDSKQYLSNFNVVFENPDVTIKPVQAPQKQASFKFSLSLLKRN